MTPKQFFDDEGNPFPSTYLDDRAGVRHAQGGYELAEGKQRVDRLPADTFAAVREKAQQGEEQLSAGDYRAAYKHFSEALQLLPDPAEQWNATGWLLVALGECAMGVGNFEAAEAPLSDAMWCPGTIGNPWVHLRLGQARFELGKLEAAGDELARAYMGGGREVFEGQDVKYFSLVEELLEPPPGMSRLP